MEEKKRNNRVWYYIIGVFIIVLIVLIILPAFQKHGHSPMIAGLSNSHNLSVSIQIYFTEKDSWPNKANWCDLIKPYLEGDNYYFKCPEDNIGPCSYAMNENIPDDANELPDDMVLLFESSPGWNLIGGPDDVVTVRHKRPGASITFADGRVEFVKPEDIPNLRWTVEE